jgi:hypothetical protein
MYLISKATYLIILFLPKFHRQFHTLSWKQLVNENIVRGLLTQMLPDAIDLSRNLDARY